MDSIRRQLLLAGVSAGVIIDAPALAAPTIRTLDIEANGRRFHALEAGEGPLALCLHGFPDSVWTYRHLLPKLARAGYRAVAPFMRGYAPTAIPADNDFSTRALAADANGLHAALGGNARAVLIAHDWGSAAAYGALIDQPGRWRRAAVLNVPPWGVFGQIAFRYDQLKRSFYFWLFQMGVAESIVGANDLAFIEGLWRDWSPGFDPTGEMPRVKAYLRDPARLRAALGYYRDFFAADRFGTPAWAEAQTAVLGGPVTRPTLYLHGTQDGCISHWMPRVPTPSARRCRPDRKSNAFRASVTSCSWRLLGRSTAGSSASSDRPDATLLRGRPARSVGRPTRASNPRGVGMPGRADSACFSRATIPVIFRFVRFSLDKGSGPRAFFQIPPGA